MVWPMIAAAVMSAASARNSNKRASADAAAASAESNKREPWAPAQPFIQRNLETTQGLQDYYQQNPFNHQQQTSYQNLFGDLDNFRQNTAPGLMNFANNAMTGNYQRQRGGAPGSGGGYGGPVQMGGLLQNNQQRPFGVQPGRQYGLLDLNSQNPFRNGAIQRQEPVAPVAPPIDLAYAEWLRQQGVGSGYISADSGL